MSGMDELYQDIILEHHQEPSNFGYLEKADAQKEGYNPVCGDRVLVQVKWDENQSKLEGIRFEGESCSICMASSSMMTEEVENQTWEKVADRIEQFRGLMQGEFEPGDFEGDLASLAGVRRFPVRIKCALLPWMTLKELMTSQSSMDGQEKEGADQVKTEENTYDQ